MNNLKVDDCGNPLPAYDLDDCTLYYDPSGDGTFWDEEIGQFDLDGNNKISFEEWSLLYEPVAGCTCENSEAMFARFDADSNGEIALLEIKSVWEYFTGFFFKT